MAEKAENGVKATSSDALDENEEEDRGTWGSPAEFILSCLGYAVGLGNVWRFPYMCFVNGGGAFLIPYAVMLAFVGLPIFFIELSAGQFSGEGPISVWSVSPLFQGVGVGMLVISFIGSIYYNMIIAWSLYYMFASFQANLPWASCGNNWNTHLCYSKREATDCEGGNGTWYNQTCFNSTSDPMDLVRAQNMSGKLVSPSEEYFNFAMLDRSDRIEDTGPLKWDLVLVLLLSWIICYLCILKGIRSSGKVVYFTATFPYVVLIILFFRGITLEGAGKGIDFYIKPDWELIKTPKVWVDAAGQIFFSLSVGMGGLMTYASYNKFHNNVWRDTLIVTIGNCLTSFFAGFVIFSVLGFMANELGKDVKDVAASGSGLAFVAYPEVVTRLPVSQLWSILFFFMLLTLGLDSQFAGLENLQTAFTDVFPRFRKRKWVVSGILCIIMFIIGLPMCARSGIYWEELMSYYSSGWSLVLIGFAEGVIFPWIYGGTQLLEDIKMMIGYRPPPWQYWWFLWMIFTPILLLVILIFNMIDFTPLSYGDYVFPQWAQILGWLMAFASVAMIPIVAVGRIIYTYCVPDPRYNQPYLDQRIIALTKPTEDWKPSLYKSNRSAGPSNKGVDNLGMEDTRF